MVLARSIRLGVLPSLCVFACCLSHLGFGQSECTLSWIELSTLDGENGFIAEDAWKFHLGRSIACTGDMDGDGFDEMGLVADSEVYVVSGGATLGASGALSLKSLHGPNGVRMFFDGIYADVAGAGDFNGDGLDDLILGDREGVGWYDEGAAFIVYGSANLSFLHWTVLENLDGTDGFRIESTEAHGILGKAVSSAGACNGDGLDDVVIGHTGSDPAGVANAGAAHVVFGFSNSGGGSTSPVLDVADLDGSNGFSIHGVAAGDQAGWDVSGGFDFNADGFDDIVIGAPEAFDGSVSPGYAYVVFGGTGVGSTGLLHLAGLDGSNGFAVRGEGTNGLLGLSSAALGDVNADGYDDLLVGDQRAGTGEAGRAYVLFGRPSPLASALFDLRNLAAPDGFYMEGKGNSNALGRANAAAGDINNDGQDDLVVGAASVRVHGEAGAGETYVVYGGAGLGASGYFDIGAIDGVTGRVLQGTDSLDKAGSSVAGGGDFNGDGQDDLLVAASGLDSAYVVYDLVGRLSLTGDPASISLSAGGTHTLCMNGGVAHAGGLYLTLGTLSGTDPGQPYKGFHIPLNVDWYTSMLFLQYNAAFFPDSVGILDGQGMGASHLSVAPGTDPTLVGLRVDHAYLVFGLGGRGLEYVSAAAKLLLDA